jgi:hypothetical protein
MRRASALSLVWLAAWLGGCTAVVEGIIPPPGSDGGSMDAGRADAGPQDAGGPDTGAPDGCVPAGDELCNDADDDCDGTVDETPTDCTFDNAAGVCEGGECLPGACDPGFLDCDAEPGCETAETHAACGGCDSSCGVEQACTAGSCRPVGVQALIATLTGSNFREVGRDDAGRLYVIGNPRGACSAGVHQTLNDVELEIHGRTGTNCSDALVAQLSASGDVNWVRQAWTESGVFSLQDLAVEPAGGVTVIGFYTEAGRMNDDPQVPGADGVSVGTPAGATGIVMRFAADGSLDWRSTTSGSGRVTDLGLARDAEGNLYWIGRAIDEVRWKGVAFATGERGIFVIKTTNGGDARAFTRYADVPGLFDLRIQYGGSTLFWAARIDGTATIGSLAYDHNDFHWIVTRLDPADLSVIDGFRHGTTDCLAEEYQADFVVDPEDRLYLLNGCNGMDGEYGDTRLPPGMHLAGIDPRATSRWARMFGMTDGEFGSTASRLAASPRGLFASGRFNRESDYGGGALTPDSADAVLVRYLSDGTYAWAKQLGGSSGDEGGPVVPDGAGGAYWAVRLRGTVELAPGLTVDPGGSRHGYLLRVAPEMD